MSRLHAFAAAGVAIGLGVFNGYYVFNPALKDQKAEQNQEQQQRSSITKPELDGDAPSDVTAMNREASASPYASPYVSVQNGGSVWARIREQVGGVFVPGDAKKGFKVDEDSEERYR